MGEEITSDWKTFFDFFEFGLWFRAFYTCRVKTMLTFVLIRLSKATTVYRRRFCTNFLNIAGNDEREREVKTIYFSAFPRVLVMWYLFKLTTSKCRPKCNRHFCNFFIDALSKFFHSTLMMRLHRHLFWLDNSRIRTHTTHTRKGAILKRQKIGSFMLASRLSLLL